jgi:hypothetical protein
MIVIRATQRLLKNSGIMPAAEPPETTSVLGDWFATAMVLPGRRPVVLYVSSATLLAVLVPGRAIHTALPAFRTRLRALLTRLGLSGEWVDRVIEEAAEHVIARTDSRRMLGIMNDIVASMPYYGDESLDELELRLGDTPYSAPENPGYLFPRTATANLAGQPYLAKNFRPSA